MSTMRHIGTVPPIPGYPAVAPRITCTSDPALIARVLAIKREHEHAHVRKA